MKRREAGDVLEPPQCLHYSLGASKRCRETAVPDSGLCPLHHTLRYTPREAAHDQ